MIFTLLVGWVVALNQCARDREHRAAFEGWKLAIKEAEGDRPVQELYWQEVERFLESAFERWKFVKSLSSGAYWLTPHTIEPAEKTGWVIVDRKDRLITVDFASAVDNGHATRADKRAKPA